MNFTIVSMEHRATLHYSDTNCVVGVDNVMVMVKNEKINHENRDI